MLRLAAILSFLACAAHAGALSTVQIPDNGLATGPQANVVFIMASAVAVELSGVTAYPSCAPWTINFNGTAGQSIASTAANFLPGTDLRGNPRSVPSCGGTTIINPVLFFAETPANQLWVIRHEGWHMMGGFSGKLDPWGNNTTGQPISPFDSHVTWIGGVPSFASEETGALIGGPVRVDLSGTLFFEQPYHLTTAVPGQGGVLDLMNPTIPVFGGLVPAASLLDLTIAHAAGVPINDPRIFDPAWYANAYLDVAAAWLSGALPSLWFHYDQLGWREGRNPNGLFDTDRYLAANPDVRAVGINPFAHYLQIGWREGRSP